jgi:catechol 2,3-dioxygenase-like lactoylglutathione lyase family enzyme
MIRLHHVGYVVRDIELFAAGMPGLELDKAVDDPLQHARLALYRVGEGAFIELIQPDGPEAFTWGALARGGEGMHHLCYEGASETEAAELMKKYKMLKVRGPMHAPLFDRPVVFGITRQRALLEFLL